MVSSDIDCSKIRPGDVIAFSGTDLPSDVVKLATRSHYVHVAIVFAVMAAKNPDQTILIAESHIDTSLPSLGTGQRGMGVQFHWLSQRLALPGPVWWAGLRQPLAGDRLMKMQSWLNTLEQQRVPYDFVQAIKVGLDALIPDGLEPPKALQNLPSEHAFFCSELVTRSLQIAGVVDPTINPAAQTPAEVMTFDCLQPPVLLKATEAT
jgi:hypothetical protein